jgi:hypothetical protein
VPKTAKSAEPTIFQDLTPDRTGCPHCGRPMTADYANRRTVHTLAGVTRLTLTVRRCRHAPCPAHKRPYRPEAEGAVALPRHEFGLDVIALIGRLRYAEHRSVPEIRAHLVGRGVSVSERAVTNLLDRYDELLAVALTDDRRLKRVLTTQGKVVLAVDGLQPDVGHEVLWVLRDCLSGEILLAKSLLSVRQRDLAELLIAVKVACPVPIIAVVSDGQHSIRKAVPGLRSAVRGRPQEGAGRRGRAVPGPPPVGRAARGPGHRPGHRPVPVVGPGVRQRPRPGGHPARPRTAPKKSAPVVIEADELWSFVGSKEDVHWVWVALDAGTRRVPSGSPRAVPITLADLTGLEAKALSYEENLRAQHLDRGQVLSLDLDGNYRDQGDSITWTATYTLAEAYRFPVPRGTAVPTACHVARPAAGLVRVAGHMPRPATKHSTGRRASVGYGRRAARDLLFEHRVFPHVPSGRPWQVASAAPPLT